MSTSKPLNPESLLLSKSSNGAYGTSEHTVNVPDLTRLRSGPPELPVLSSSELPQAVRASPRAEVIASAFRRFRVVMRQHTRPGRVPDHSTPSFETVPYPR